MRLAGVYSREIDDRVLTLSASGWLYRSTFVLFDYDTESLWYHLQGEDGLTCIGGFYAGRKLEEFLSSVGRWDRWKRDNPDTDFLKYP